MRTVPADYDFKYLAERMHRRAQRAESQLIRSERVAASRLSLWKWAVRRMTTLKNREKAQRKRANRLLRTLEAEQMHHRPHLRRIIEMGKRFP